MSQQTLSLLQSIWKSPSWRNEVLNTFEHWVQASVSRSGVKSELRAVIGRYVIEQATLYPDGIDLEQINWDQLVEFLCLCFYQKRFRRSLPDVPSNERWMKLTDELNQGSLSSHPQQDKPIKETVPASIVPLEQRLIALGGICLVYRHEPDLELLLRRGKAFSEPVELVSGEPHQCHLNVAQFWREHREDCAIVTGYALSEDGLWRQHSWLRQEDLATGQSHLLETTISRVAYFGVVLTETEAEKFAHRAQ